MEVNHPFSPKDQDTPVPKLSKVLNGWQIFFISLSAVIGTGIFNFDGLAINFAGPIGYLVALLIVAVIAISFMDGLSEMVQVFPCTNALILFVRVFVDEQLATCVGWAYWMAWSSLVHIQIASAAEFAAVWVHQDSKSINIALRASVFGIICPIVIYIVNTRHVSVFGWIETAGGVIKLLFTVGFALCLYYVAGQVNIVDNLSSYARPAGIADGITRRSSYLDPPFAQWNGTRAAVSNVFAVVSLVAFSWVGIDVIAVTAFEAREPENLRLPSQGIGYAVFVIYIIFGIGSALSVSPLNPALAHIYTPGEMPFEGNATAAQSMSVLANSTAIITIAAEQIGSHSLGAVSNGFLIFSALSAANTCLYTASRALYGLAVMSARVSGTESGFLQRKFLDVKPNQVPRWAVAASLAAFIWVPFLGLASANGNPTVPAAIRQFINVFASTAVVFVWGTGCLAFIRYYYWLRRNHNRGYIASSESRHHLDRWNPARSRSHTLLRRIQPIPAYIGLTGCFLIVLVFPTAIWWAEAPHHSSGWIFDAFEIYSAPSFIVGLWSILKLRVYRNGDYEGLFITLKADKHQFKRIIDDLDRYSQENRHYPESAGDDQQILLEQFDRR